MRSSERAGRGIESPVVSDPWHNVRARRRRRRGTAVLRAEESFDRFWFDNRRLGPCQRFFAGLQAIGLHGDSLASGGAAPGHPRLVIFLDEIDVVRSLPFPTDEFFSAIRECYNRRVEDPGLQRLSFCLLGVASPP